MYAHESRLTRSQDVPPSFAYPTPGTGRKNDLEPASAPRHDLRGICDADVEDSDSPTEGSITTSRPVFNKVVGTNSAKHTESLQRNDESKDEGGGKGGLEADSSWTTRKEATKCWVLLKGKKDPETRKVVAEKDAGFERHRQMVISLVAKFDDAGKAVWFVNRILVPHFDCGFNKEWEKWGTSAIDVIRDQSRWDPSNIEYLESVTDAKWRVVVKNGVYATMFCVWKKYQGDAGEGREWSDKCRMLNRRQSRKDASRRVVQEPKYRIAKLVQFLGALDIAYKDNKKRCGNQKVTRRDLIRHKSKSMQTMAKQIDLDLDKIPQEEKFDKFIDRYAPQPREYLSPLPSPFPLASPLPSESNAPANTPVASVTLATQSQVIELTPVTTPILLDTNVCHSPGNAAHQPPLDVPAALLMPPVMPPAFAAPEAPAFVQPAFPQYGQLGGAAFMPHNVLPIGYQPGFQPGYLYGQPSRNGGTQAHIPIDPTLQGETIGRLYPSNGMPPPPELHEQEATAAATQHGQTAQPNMPGPSQPSKTRLRAAKARKSRMASNSGNGNGDGNPGLDPLRPPWKRCTQQVKQVKVVLRGA
ncbi:hypothetical protein RHS01_04995 [Rhizoctonia solani]|uniref:Uncharacterized protein n=1 Tax=Rhizoctonia solani TaxID=456999 RepID=A0A8H7IBZ6_9AGAM|nr:hypothetical protein RHS01_04995 [Rhizoctonia solani]